jgi:long-subunit fatty acid transport protein
MHHFPLSGLRRPRLQRLVLAAALAAAGCALVPAAARADERADLEQLRATTLALIDALVQQGLLTREKAEAIVRSVQAARPAAAAAAAVPGPQWGAPVAAAAPAATASGVIRVPYISETLRAQIREEVKNEVLATAREERWADPRALPDWVRGITVSGDLRVRAQSERYDAPVYALDGNGVRVGGACDILAGNLPAECYRAQTTSPAWAPDLANTGINRDRLTLRARLAFDAKVGEDTSAGLRLSTGTTSGPTSSSQTLGAHFNKAGIVLDRAFVRWEPRYDWRVFAGRMANPFFGSDLLWPEDLGFDGVAAQTEQNLAAGVFAFFNAGAFPLEEFNVDARDKWLYGVQAGLNWALGSSTELKLGLGVYDFHRIEGVRETEPPPSGSRAGTVPYLSAQYPSTVRQKGNTLINLNDPTSSTSAATWGLASKFRPINLTAALTLKQWEPLALNLGLDVVKNSAFDLADIRTRAGTTALDTLQAKTTGLQLKASLGRGRLADKGDWQLSAALRKFERDAWPDGFTDTTWHLGGTNYKGWQLGASYALDRRTTLGLRLTSTRNLDDGQRYLSNPGDPTSVSSSLSNAPLKIDVIQLDLNTRF